MKRSIRFLINDYDFNFYFQFVDRDGLITKTDMEFINDYTEITFEIPDLINDKDYRVSLMRVSKHQPPQTVAQGGPGGGPPPTSQDPPADKGSAMLTLEFRCSEYNTFNAKMNAFIAAKSFSHGPGSYALKVQSGISEGFDDIELNSPLISIYDASFHDEVYNTGTSGKTNENKVLKELYVKLVQMNSSDYHVWGEDKKLTRANGKVWFKGNFIQHGVYNKVADDIRSVQAQIATKIQELKDIAGEHGDGDLPILHIPGGLKAIHKNDPQPNYHGRNMRLIWSYTLPYHSQANSHGEINFVAP